MNLKFITGWSMPSSTTIESLSTLDLALCGQGRPEGSAAGMVPLQLAAGVVVTPVVTVTSNTSTTKRNSRSAVIKVSLPYTALTIDAEGHIVADPTRSGADLSMHIVLALPASAVKDLKGSSGSVSQQAAESQVALVHYLLASLIGRQFGELPYYWQNSAATAATLKNLAHPAPVVGSDGNHEGIDEAAVAPMPTTGIGGFEGAGFNLSTVKVRKDLNSALSRIANGLPALSCNDASIYATHRNHEEP